MLFVINKVFTMNLSNFLNPEAALNVFNKIQLKHIVKIWMFNENGCKDLAECFLKSRRIKETDLYWNYVPKEFLKRFFFNIDFLEDGEFLVVTNFEEGKVVSAFEFVEMSRSKKISENDKNNSEIEEKNYNNYYGNYYGNDDHLSLPEGVFCARTSKQTETVKTSRELFDITLNSMIYYRDVEYFDFYLIDEETIVRENEFKKLWKIIPVFESPYNDLLSQETLNQVSQRMLDHVLSIISGMKIKISSVQIRGIGENYFSPSSFLEKVFSVSRENVKIGKKLLIFSNSDRFFSQLLPLNSDDDIFKRLSSLKGETKETNSIDRSKRIVTLKIDNEKDLFFSQCKIASLIEFSDFFWLVSPGEEVKSDEISIHHLGYSNRKNEDKIICDTKSLYGLKMVKGGEITSHDYIGKLLLSSVKNSRIFQFTGF